MHRYPPSTDTCTCHLQRESRLTTHTDIKPLLQTLIQAPPPTYTTATGPWKKRACRGPATVTRQPSLVINQFFHHIKLQQPYDVCRHQRTLKVLQLLKLPYYQRCARESVVIACVSKKYTDPPISQGQGTMEIITIVMPGVVHSVYKPPNDSFELPALGHRNLPLRSKRL